MLVPPNFWTTHPLGQSFLIVGFMAIADVRPMRRVFVQWLQFYVPLSRGYLSLRVTGSGGADNESKVEIT